VVSPATSAANNPAINASRAASGDPRSTAQAALAASSRAPASRPGSSARPCWMAWKVPIATSNCSRSVT
jgi:hypothetical protein